MPTVRFAAILVSTMAACTTVLGGDGSETEPGGSDAGAGRPDAGAGSGSDAGGGGGSDCPSVEVALTESIPTVLLLIDRSGTMAFAFGNTDRWSAVFRTLMDGTTGLVSRLQQDVRFGVALYTSDDGFAGGPCPFIEQVPPALGNYGAILELYAGRGPIEDTPTAASLDAARATLATIQEPGPKVIVLATDGEPDTCDVPDPDGLDPARAASVSAAQAAHAAGMDVHVISVGDEVAQDHLQDMANAGVGLPVGGAEDAPFYQALDPDALVAAFDTIIGAVRECTFAIDGTVSLDRAGAGTVTLDGVELTFGTDWRLADQNTLELLGSACAAIRAGGDHTVTAAFDCGVIVD